MELLEKFLKVGAIITGAVIAIETMPATAQVPKSVDIADSVKSIAVNGSVLANDLRLTVRLRGGVPSFSGVRIPREQSDTCSYVPTEFNAFVYGKLPGDAAPASCDPGLMTALLYTIDCEIGESFTEDIDFFTDAAAEQAGIQLVAPSENDDAYVTSISRNHTCNGNGTASGYNKIGLVVPGTASAYEGQIGTVLIQLNY